MKENDIIMESETKQRKIAKTWAGEVVVKSAPFQFPLPDTKGKYEVRDAPWGYLEDLPEHVINYLDSLDE